MQKPPDAPDLSSLHSFVSLVWEMGERHRRDGLPWRGINDPYAVLVSEVMLQQTQVSRVERYWPQWMRDFPSIDALSSASPSDVLTRWQGLGYNRRALALHRLAQTCSSEFAGKLPTTYDALLALPGVGPATAAGVVSFAYQKPSIYIETNVRAVFIHHFFADATEKVHDRDIAPLVEKTCSSDDPRGWYYALLDYGAYLKATYPNPSRKSAAHTKQSRFEGSSRQKRSFVLREVLSAECVSTEHIHDLLDESEKLAGREAVPQREFDRIVGELVQEGFFRDEDGHLTL